MSEKIIILDFGSQYTQLIARRIREHNVYSEIVPYNTDVQKIIDQRPIGIILSGGPQSVYEKDAIQAEEKLFQMNVPVLGICYGLQAMGHHFGGKVSSSDKREYGLAEITHTHSALMKDIPAKFSVWMSHGDEIIEEPKGFAVTARSENAVAALDNTQQNLYGLQFHPEVAHTEYGAKILENFLEICDAQRDWSMGSYVDQAVATIREQVGDKKVICALSGGVDSSVAAALVAKAVGDQQTCIFVDTGLLRENEYEEVLEAYKELKLNIEPIRASERFLTELAGVTDPEKKRKIIGNEFIKIFDEQATVFDGAEFLVQGTLYPDVIESVSVNGPSAVIKSHHNVGGLPEHMKLNLVEPLRELFKDEVRELGRELGLPEAIVARQPFPGPGLAIRILGEVNEERLVILRKSDLIVQQEFSKATIDNDIWQAFAVLLPISSVGVMGDKRTYENTIALRAVESVDGMTADWARLPYDLLHNISSRVISEVKGINRVVYDVSSKPPATIEWE